MQKIISTIVPVFILLLVVLAPSAQAITTNNNTDSTGQTQLSPVYSGNFAIGDTIQTTGRLTVRSTAAGTSTTVVSAGAQGTIKGGPTVATLASDGLTYTWWQIDFGTVTGWSADGNANGPFFTKVNSAPINPNNSGATFPQGCTSASGFSTTTGQSCSGVTTPDDGSTSPQTLTADLKINGSDGPITVASQSNLNFSWTTTGTPTQGGQIVCGVEPNVPIGNPGGASGTYTLQYTGNNPYYPWDSAYVSHNYKLTCFDQGSTRTATDTVTVLPTGVSETPTTSVSLQAMIDTPLDFSNGTPTGTWSHPTVSSPLVLTNANQRLSFKWTSANANSCSLGAPISDIHSPTTSIYSNGNSWIQFSATDTAHIPAVGSTVTYSITCTGIQPDGTNGTATDSVVVTNSAQTIQGIDLTANAPTPDTTPIVNTPVRFDFMVMNIGTVTSGLTFSNQLNVSTSATRVSPTSLTPVSVTTQLGVPGGSGVNTVSPFYTFPSVGTYYVQACADSGNTITEADETNNCSVWTPVTVVATAPPGPTITSVSPSTGVLGSTTMITVTGTNFGTGNSNWVRFSQGGVAKDNMQVYNPSVTSLQFNLSGVAPIMKAGAYTIQVNGSNSLPFIITGGAGSPTFPAGCTSASGFSTTTGMSCSVQSCTNCTVNNDNPNPGSGIPNSASSAFNIGDRVMISSGSNVSANVRTSGTTSASISCTQADGNTGTVAAGPVSANGFNWWQVNYDKGCDGWTAETLLAKVGTETSSPSGGGSSSGGSGSVGSHISTSPIGIKANGVSGSINIGLGTPVVLAWTVPTNITSACYESSSPASSFSGPLTPVNNGSLTTYTTSGIEVYTITCGDAHNSVTVNTSNTAQAASGNGNGDVGLSIGSTVSTTTSLNVRSEPTINSTIVAGAPVPEGTSGTVVAGPTADIGGNVWWKINFTGGVSGWSVGAYLAGNGSMATSGSSLPNGCTATTLYSTTTGEPCSANSIQGANKIAQSYVTPYFQVYGTDGLTPTKTLTIPYGQMLILPWGMYGTNTWTCSANPGSASGSASGVLQLAYTNVNYPPSGGSKVYTLNCNNTVTGQTSTDSVTVSTTSGPSVNLNLPVQQGVSYTNPFIGPPDWTIDLSQLNQTSGLWMQWGVSQPPTIPATTSCSFTGFPSFDYWGAKQTQSSAGYVGNVYLHAVPTPSGIYGGSGVTAQSVFGTLPLNTSGNPTYTVSCTDSATGKTSSAHVNLTFK